MDHKQIQKPKEQFKESQESTDFYELLINCQNSADPIMQLQIEALRWFTPVLSVFATFYQVIPITLSYAIQYFIRFFLN